MAGVFGGDHDGRGLINSIKAHIEQNTYGTVTVTGEARVDNCYPRAVQPEGNPKARAQVESIFEVADADWRGLGTSVPHLAMC